MSQRLHFTTILLFCLCLSINTKTMLLNWGSWTIGEPPIYRCCLNIFRNSIKIHLLCKDTSLRYWRILKLTKFYSTCLRYSKRWHCRLVKSSHIFYYNTQENQHVLHINSFGWRRCRASRRETLTTNRRGCLALNSIWASCSSRQKNW